MTSKSKITDDAVIIDGERKYEQGKNEGAFTAPNAATEVSTANPGFSDYEALFNAVQAAKESI